MDLKNIQKKSEISKKSDFSAGIRSRDALIRVKIFTVSHFWVCQNRIEKYFSRLYCSKGLCHPTNKKNWETSPQHLKNRKNLIFTDFRLYQACPRAQIFTLSQFFGRRESSWKIFFVTTLFHMLAPSCTPKTKPRKLLISSQTTF